MEDIFELTWFYYWDLFEKSSFFVVFIVLILYFLLKRYFFKNKKEVIKDYKKEEKYINFLEELEKIKEKSLKKYLELFSKFLEKKYNETEFSKMTLSEIKNIKNLENNEKKLFEKLYFLIYSWENIDEKLKKEIFEEFLNIIK